MYTTNVLCNTLFVSSIFYDIIHYTMKITTQKNLKITIHSYLFTPDREDVYHKYK